MTLAERLSEYGRACFKGIWVQSFEHDEAITEIARRCRQQRWSLATWDIDRGLTVVGRDEGSDTAVNAPDPLAAIKAIGSLATPDGTALLVLRNFHRFLGSIEVVQALDTAIAAGKQNRTILLILSPVLQIPSERERQFVVIEHDLPPRDQIHQIAFSQVSGSRQPRPLPRKWLNPSPPESRWPHPLNPLQDDRSGIQAAPAEIRPHIEPAHSRRSRVAAGLPANSPRRRTTL
jgi:hypothetical protein